MATLTLTLSTANQTLATVNIDVRATNGGRQAVVEVVQDSTKNPSAAKRFTLTESTPGTTWQLVSRVVQTIAVGEALQHD